MDLGDLNLNGWLLVLATVALSLGIGVPIILSFMQSLPAGRYPRILFMIPTIVIAVIVFFGGKLILSAMGIKITKN